MLAGNVARHKRLTNHGPSPWSSYVAHTETRCEHVVLSDEGIPLIAGTTMKVIELVLAQAAYGWSPEELHFQFPHLSLGQIHSALAYYWDHRASLDENIARRTATVERLREQSVSTPLREHLRARRLI